MEILYNNEDPHLLDSTLTEAVLGLRPTPLDTVLRDTLTGRSTTAGTH